VAWPTGCAGNTEAPTRAIDWRIFFLTIIFRIAGVSAFAMTRWALVDTVVAHMWMGLSAMLGPLFMLSFIYLLDAIAS